MFNYCKIQCHVFVTPHVIIYEWLDKVTKGSGYNEIQIIMYDYYYVTMYKYTWYSKTSYHGSSKKVFQYRCKEIY